MRTARLRKLFCLSFLVWRCTLAAAQPTYDHYTTLFDKNKSERAGQFMHAFRQVPVPQPVSAQISTGWTFFTGKPSEGLVTKEVQQQGEPVTLPHRIDKADHPLWYFQTLAIQEPGVLTIIGDDGVQLFVNGRQVPRIESNDFRIDASGTLKLTIRVLNNAMAGGLHAVRYTTNAAYSAYRSKRALYKRLAHLVEKATLLKALPEASFALVRQAIGNFDSSTLTAAERSLQDYPMLTGPYLQPAPNGSVYIMCETDGAGPISLYMGASKDRLELVAEKEAPLAVFEPGNMQRHKRYYYQIKSGKTQTGVYAIDLADRKSFTFNVWADSQSGWEAFSANVKQMARSNDDFGIAAGDLVADGFDADHWRRFLNIISLSAAEHPYYFIAGNHDYDGYYEDLKPENYLRYTRNAPGRYFSWTWQNAAFIALDPNESFPIGIPESSEQYTWFHDRIQSEAWKNATWRFVLMHQPPYSQGWPGYHGDECIRRLLEPVIESARIDFVISGHTHDYERLTKQFGVQKATFLIVGGGGGSLEPPGSSSEYPQMDKVIKTHHFGRFTIDGKKLTFRALNASGETLDSYNIQKP